MYIGRGEFVSFSCMEGTMEGRHERRHEGYPGTRKYGKGELVFTSHKGEARERPHVNRPVKISHQGNSLFLINWLFIFVYLKIAVWDMARPNHEVICCIFDHLTSCATNSVK